MPDVAGVDQQRLQSMVLTDRQVQILRLVGTDRSIAEIAQELVVSVDHHVSAVLHKLGAHRAARPATGSRRSGSATDPPLRAPVSERSAPTASARRTPVYCTQRGGVPPIDGQSAGEHRASRCRATP